MLPPRRSQATEHGPIACKVKHGRLIPRHHGKHQIHGNFQHHMFHGGTTGRTIPGVKNVKLETWLW